MNVVMISGSRDPQGKTSTMANALLQGATKEGATCERFFLAKLKVEHCRQCDDQGWGDCRAKGQCVIEDEFEELVTAIREADAVVWANPVYFGDLSESLRAFLDRLRRVTRHESAKPGVDAKPAIGVCVAGGGGGGAPACACSLEKVLQTCGFDVLDLIPVRRQNMDLKTQVLETTGRWLVKQLKGS